jgi:hypothetical protein
MAFEFVPGEYDTECGSQVVVLESFGGYLFGRVLGNGIWRARQWELNGSCTNYERGDNLVPPKQKRTYWANIYPQRSPCLHVDEESARSGRKPHKDCIACVKVELEFTPGEGLDG